MKKKVRYNAMSIIVPILSIAVLAGFACLRSMRRGDPFFLWFLAGLVIFMIILMLFLAPVSVSLTDKEIKLNSLLGSKKIPFDKIISVKPFIPSSTVKSRLGSRNWLGTWGWFKDNRIGSYRAFYGVDDGCFLVTLSNGKMFLIGCEDSDQVMDAIIGKCNLNHSNTEK